MDEYTLVYVYTCNIMAAPAVAIKLKEYRSFLWLPFGVCECLWPRLGQSWTPLGCLWKPWGSFGSPPAALGSFRGFQ